MPGETLSIPLWILNDTDETKDSTVRLILSDVNPLYQFEGIGNNLGTESEKKEVTLAAHAATSVTRSLSIPGDISLTSTGTSLWLVALLEKEDKPIAMSQREIRVHQPISSLALEGTNIWLTHENPEIQKNLLDTGAKIIKPDNTNKVPFTIIVPPSDKFPLARDEWDRVTRMVEKGARCVVLRTKEIPDAWPLLPGITKLKNATDYLFPGKDISLSPVKEMNGPEPVLQYSIEGLDDSGRILLYGYPDSSGKAAIAGYTRPYGKGTITFLQIELENRLGNHTPHNDPVGNQILVDILRGIISK
jgi:hypothetical protein